ncbi:pyridoxal phosphate-dependent aminotransferase [Methanotorris igneus]|uniref:Aminotransferase n=1 Tax=Methanotorris igneus (strain DSM 5666 / JCM 11834 / Kol 5) TaxID=880724 RepID=F6BEW1_METIK|nr:pyridoxal phosphate-dependent aminotransferase [Methanotorris igneus]AEF95697.1 Aspartate transaminase [Methanotorris igneus Kol 5]
MLSERVINFESFEVMDILAKCEEMERRGEDVIHLEIGEPDFDTPKPIVDACLNALKDGKTHYTDSLGIYDLREKISEEYKGEYGVDVSPNNIIITGGSSLGLFFAISSIIDKGDKVLIQNPSYPCYRNIIKFCGGVPVYCNFEDIESYISKRTKAVIINSPSNPLGEVISREIFEEIYENIPYVISDEIYSGLIYEGKHISAIEFDENLEKTIVVNGFSKLYAMTGWRIGYVISNKEIINAILKLQQNLFIAPTTFVQYGALKVFDEDVKKARDEMIKEFDRRRRLVLKYVKSFGWEVNNPIGAYYVFPNIGMDGREFSTKLLEEKKVATVPGIAFGSAGKNHIRISYANSYEKIKEGMERIEEFIENNF